MIINDINVPYYQQLKIILEGKIREGVFKAGEKIPSESELGREFSISRITAKRALKELVLNGLVVRRQGKGSFVRAGITDKKKKYCVGIFSPLAKHLIQNDPYYKRVINGILNACDELECEVKSLELEDLCNPNGINGVLFLGMNDNFPISRYFTFGLPFILVGYPSEEPAINYVAVDNFMSSYIAVRHLIECGHSRIGFISHFKTSMNVRERINGYREALNHANINYLDDLAYEGDGWTNGGYVSMNSLLALSDPPTAVIAASDGMAFSALKAITEHGFKVPDDISVIGMGNLMNEIAPDVSLTSIELFPEKMGEAALTGILKIIKNPLGPPVKIRTDVELKYPSASCKILTKQVTAEVL